MSTSDVEVVEELEDEELQRALALSMEEFKAAGTGAGGASGAAAHQEQQQPRDSNPASPAAQQHQQQDQQLTVEGARKPTPRQPMRGKRKQAEPPAAAQEVVAPPAARGRKQRTPAGPAGDSTVCQAPKSSPASQVERQPGKPAEQRGKQAPPAAAAGAGPAKQRQARGKKKALPAFNPSEAEVEACFEALTAGGGSLLTVNALVEVSQAAGGDIDVRSAQNMMAYVAERVLGWGSSAGRGQGALGLPAFRQVIDHFRVV